MQILCYAMEQTVLDGTEKARVPGYRVAGKTGTAEKINPETGTRWEGKYLVSFIGCAPVDDPQLTVYVVVDEPNVENQETGGYSMIISRKIMMEVLPYLNIPQTEEITDELLQELELTREDVENGRNAALIKENQRQRRQMNTEMSSLPERPLRRTSTEMSSLPVRPLKRTSTEMSFPLERHPAVHPLRQAQPMLRHHRRMLMEM